MILAPYTLGCKVNQADTEKILKELTAYGFTIADFSKKADVYFINTCTVTNISDRKTRQIIGKARRNNPDAVVVAYGCYAQVRPADLETLADLVIGTSQKSRAAEIIAEHVGNCHGTPKGAHPTHDAGRAVRTRRAKAYLKIQDGCDRFCSYCIVPTARGKPTCLTPEEVCHEAESLVAEGYKEIVLTGIQLSSYGNADKDSLPALIRKINASEKLERLEHLYLGSLAPDAITPAFLQMFAETPKLSTRLHISLQSGSDEILRKMNRRYTTAEFFACADALRKTRPDCSLTTDIIVGFPSETDLQFEETRNFAKRIGFAKIHVFPFSPKQGTAAAEMDGQISDTVKEHRKKILLELNTTGGNS